MSAGFVRWLLSRTVRTARDVNPGHWAPASRSAARCNISALPWRCSPFTTAEGNTEETTPAPEKKKKDPRAQDTISNAGRMIPHPTIHVFSDAGENLGIMRRAQAVKIMDQKNLKLVLLDKDKVPPIYKLMDGKRIHEEQMKLLAKRKAKPAVVQEKEVTLLCGIAAHDVNTKMKQVESWLEKKYHVRITLRAKKKDPAANLDRTLEQMVQQMDVMVGYVSTPKVIRDGKAAMCVLRQPTAKDLCKKNHSKAAALPSPDKSANATPKERVNASDATQRSAEE
ncbi:translation initiation factor IF-3, mitochondrial [Brachionichthys hirsutus]|uniref:translation initiation factor IF-3, mitochondrial n=1 Tax=Brachionichthys hirsutus TaxID=412623 RepID=UPI0036043266